MNGDKFIMSHSRQFSAISTLTNALLILPRLVVNNIFWLFRWRCSICQSSHRACHTCFAIIKAKWNCTLWFVSASHLFFESLFILMNDNSDFQQAKRAALLANIAKLTVRLKVSNKWSWSKISHSICLLTSKNSFNFFHHNNC